MQGNSRFMPSHPKTADVVIYPEEGISRYQDPFAKKRNDRSNHRKNLKNDSKFI